jgi:hypothetical protein
MNNRRHYSPLEIDDLAEGSQKTSEFTEPTSHFQITTLSIVPIHGGFGDRDFSAEESTISQVGVVLEGRDDTDAQDAARTTDEAKPDPITQTVQYDSSNRTSARRGTLDLGDIGTYEHPLPRSGEPMNQSSGLTGERLIETNDYRDILAGTLQDKYSIGAKHPTNTLMSWSLR